MVILAGNIVVSKHNLYSNKAFVKQISACLHQFIKNTLQLRLITVFEQVALTILMCCLIQFQY